MDKLTYQPLKIRLLELAGLMPSLEAIRLSYSKQPERTRERDIKLLSRHIAIGDDHGKAARGIIVWIEIQCQLGWLLEYLTYKIGVDCLGSSSAMHSELKRLKDLELAEQKQQGLPEKVYTRIEKISYQALRHMYLARRNHRHPDWQLFLKIIETLPYASQLIYPAGA